MMTPEEVFDRGREITAPFELLLRTDGKLVRVEEILRLLPGRRLTARARRAGKVELLKLFARRRDYARELQGLAWLAEASLPAPRLLHATAHCIFTSYLEDAHTLTQRLAEESEQAPLLEQAIDLLDGLHEAGLQHTDPHFDNFLLAADGTLHLVDAGAIRRRYWWQPEDADLALFCSQVPLAARFPLWQVLGRDAGALQLAIARCDRLRARRYAAKAARNCTEFVAEQDWRRRLVLRRDHDGPALRAILADPDRALAAGVLLKDGNSATVARIDCEGRPLVLKRYNIKSWHHALARALQPTRAWRSWRNAALLRSLGIATPLPLAVLEHRSGPLRSTAYLLTEAVDGEPLDRAARDASLWGQLMPDVQLLFRALAVLRCSHGDCKASNFIFDGRTVWTLDLDGMRRHHVGVALRRALHRDRRRLLRNFDRATARRLAVFLDAELQTP